ncbi:MAG: hypothetical protein JZU50_08355 [Desulfobulbaceae bacterium]|nr:hypothetical protein [Desulfobulbaceae bacterium]
MTEQQQRKIIDAVRAGKTWDAACKFAKVRFEAFLDVVERGRAFRPCPACRAFVLRLEQAGKVATDASLKEHRKVGDACAKMH